MPPGAHGVNILTILVATNDFTGAVFAGVTWVGGTGTVAYLNQCVALTDVRTPSPPGFPLIDNANGATDVHGTTALLNGTLTASGGLPTTVRVFRGTTDCASNGTWAHSQSLGVCTPSGLTYRAMGLVSNTVYFYAFYASNAVGSWWAQPSMRFRTQAVPSVNAGPGATSVRGTQATLNGWLTNCPYAWVAFCYGTNAACQTSTNDLGRLTEGPCAAAIDGLTRNTTYWYQCRATNEEGVLSSATTNFTTNFTTSGDNLPDLPRVYLDTTYAPPTGGVRRAVHAGDDLEAALAAAQSGDILDLDAGARFSGGFSVGEKPGTNWIYVRSADYASLPPPGTRVQPADAAHMPKLVTTVSGQSALIANFRAHHWRFVGIEIASEANQVWNLVSLGEQNGSLAAVTNDLPHDLVFDRCYIHGSSDGSVTRGIALNSAATAVVDSWISDCHAVGYDSQALCGWNGSGPFKIVNNELEGAAENILFGGATPTIPNLIPADVEIRRNHIFKPLAWRIGDPTYAGNPWTVKNLLELKACQRVLIEGNLLEHSWPMAQVGFGILLTVRGQNMQVADVTMRMNVLQHMTSGFNMTGADDLSISQPTKRVLIENNLLTDVGTAAWGGGGGIFVQILAETYAATSDVIIQHNTGLHAGGSMVSLDGIPKHTGFIWRDNIGKVGENYNMSFHSSGMADGGPSIDASFDHALVTNNVIIGALAGNFTKYPGNFFPANVANIGFTDFSGSNYVLTAASPYKQRGTDGRDLGADIGALTAASYGCVSGDWRMPVRGMLMLFR